MELAMTTVRSEFLREITARGFLHQCTDLAALDARAAKEPIKAYIGFDCTADSLHVGSLVSIMLLRWLQRSGHKPIVLMGGGTTKIGDPSGRDDTRRLLNEAEIARNMGGIREIFAQFLTFGEGASDAVMVDNAEWLGALNYVSFLRDYGRHFSVNRMLAFDSVKLRLDREQPLSFLEFNYMVLQAYDFVELKRRYDCVLQMGGSDRSGAQGRPGGDLRPDHAAHHHRLRRQDGQDRRRRGLAQRGAPQRLRLLAILAQHRGCRCRAFPAPLHRAPRTRDRPP
jgi:tyrosyl-tRNA synthetase